ncbi:hypothetical protein VTL71DRAFT_9474 [Oculimacula yallundae]|uniref:Uncharacterized protein n=1 Tax=Oculimacula yallundae TaxID=86028 RepID=A0ABR4BUS7_9HELO
MAAKKKVFGRKSRLN